LFKPWERAFKQFKSPHPQCVNPYAVTSGGMHRHAVMIHID